jgi:hypothetical protein
VLSSAIRSAVFSVELRQRPLLEPECKVEVRWPSGAASVLENVPVGQYVLVEEPANKPAASAVQRAPVED